MKSCNVLSRIALVISIISGLGIFASCSSEYADSLNWSELSEESTNLQESSKTEENSEFDFLKNKDAKEFIHAYNIKYPDECISADQITEESYLYTYIQMNEYITFDVTESDGSTVYVCYGDMEYSQENREFFFEYVDKMISVCSYDISYDFSDEFPAYETCYSDDGKIYITYHAREEDYVTSMDPTFEVGIFKKTW